jgi:Na+/H+-dicarboxylate symporter
VLDALLTVTIPARMGMRLLSLAAVNAVVAFFIAVGVSLVFTRSFSSWFSLPTLQHLTAGSSHHGLSQGAISWRDAFDPSKLLPQSLFEPFLKGQILSLIVIALVTGWAWQRANKHAAKGSELAHGLEGFHQLVKTMLRLITEVLAVITKALPLAVFAVVAKSVGQGGLAVFQALGIFVVMVIVGMVLHAGVWYALLLKVHAGKSPREFFRAASEPILFALGAASSLATLPVTLNTLEQKLKVSPRAARLAACVGTNLNHDGILLYEAAAALFVAALYGIHLNFEQQAVLAATAVIAAVGISGIPDAGLITLSLVLGAVGLPLEAVAFLLPVDWILGRFRAAVNVTSDMVVATCIDTKETARERRRAA